MASSRVYVGDLGSGGSKPELEREFERYGPLKSVWVARNPPGFAFIEFEDPRDAEDAVRDMDGRYVCGVRIRVELAKNSSSRPGYRSNTRRGPPPNVVSSRYRRSPPRRGRSKHLLESATAIHLVSVSDKADQEVVALQLKGHPTIEADQGAAAHHPLRGHHTVEAGQEVLVLCPKEVLQPQIVTARDTVLSEENVHLVIDKWTYSSYSLVYPFPLLSFYIKVYVSVHYLFFLRCISEGHW